VVQEFYQQDVSHLKLNEQAGLCLTQAPHQLLVLVGGQAWVNAGKPWVVQ